MQGIGVGLWIYFWCKGCQVLGGLLHGLQLLGVGKVYHSLAKVSSGTLTGGPAIASFLTLRVTKMILYIVKPQSPHTIEANLHAQNTTQHGRHRLTSRASHLIC